MWCVFQARQRCLHALTSKQASGVIKFMLGTFKQELGWTVTSHLTHSHLMAIEYTWTHVGEHFKQELGWTVTSHLTHSHLMAIEYTWTHVGEHFKQELEWCDSACVTELICQLRFVQVF